MLTGLKSARKWESDLFHSALKIGERWFLNGYSRNFPEGRCVDAGWQTTIPYLNLTLAYHKVIPFFPPCSWCILHKIIF